MNFQLFLAALFMCILVAVKAAHSDDSDSSSLESDTSSVFQLHGYIDNGSETDELNLDCVPCPLKQLRKRTCGRGFVRVALDRTCYTCIRDVCVPEALLNRNDPVICTKHIPRCECMSTETCVQVQRTKQRCQEAVCVPKINGANILYDRNLVENY